LLVRLLLSTIMARQCNYFGALANTCVTGIVAADADINSVFHLVLPAAKP